MQRSRRKERWGTAHAATLAGLVALAVVVGWGAWRDIAWYALRDPEQSHVLLALPLAAWMFWLRRRRLRYARPGASWWGLGVIAAAAGIGWLGYATATDVLWHLGALGLVLGAVVAALGPRFVMLFRPALLALVFLIPVPGLIRQQVSLPLQRMSAHAAEFVFDVFAVPASRAGNSLSINGVDVTVAEACNGMRMVTALAVVAFAFIFSTTMRPGVRLLILAVTPFAALLVNVARLVPTVLMYGYAEHDAAELFHDVSGWLGLLLAFGIFWAFMGLLRWLEVPVQTYAVREAGVAA